jgi:hypothetical protein
MVGQFTTRFQPGAYRAPAEIYEALDKVFDFTDGLNHFFCDPPKTLYGTYLEQAYRAAKEEGALVVCFVPAFSDSEWWHRWALLANEIIYIKGRVALVDAEGNVKGSPIAPSCVLVFEKQNVNYPRVRAMKKVQGAYYLPRLGR